MSSDERQYEGSARPVAWTGAGLGLIAFVVGLILIVKVFGWAHEVFSGIDGQLAAVQVTAAVKSPQSPEGSQQSTGDTSMAGQPGKGSLATVAVAIALKLLGLLVMGWLGAMIAARGASMVASVIKPGR